MQIIDADPTRMIDLPGVGPCPRPVDIDESVTGFSTLKSLRIYRFAVGQVIEGESEGDEVYVVPIGGAVDLAISGTHQLEATVSEDGPRALYMTPDHGYQLTPQGDVQVAYARAEASGGVPCHVVEGTEGWDAETLRFSLQDLADRAQLESDADQERLIHLISGSVVADGVRATAPQTIALAAGEGIEMRADGAASILMITA